MDISSQVVLITGAASGMGYACAEHFSQLGAKLVLLDRNPAVASVAEQFGGIGEVLDICDTTAVETTLARVHASVGWPRIGINCAGIIEGARVVGKQGPFPLEIFQKVMQVNVLGTFNVMRLLLNGMTNLPPLEDEERGVIINVASVAAFEGQIGQAAYSASKGAIVSMTLPVAREMAQFGIRIVTLAPGLIETPMMTNMPEKVYQNLLNATEFPKRLGKPTEIAQAAASIVVNPLINGTTIRLDGAVRLKSK